LSGQTTLLPKHVNKGKKKKLNKKKERKKERKEYADISETFTHVVVVDWALVTFSYLIDAFIQLT